MTHPCRWGCARMGNCKPCGPEIQLETREERVAELEGALRRERERVAELEGALRQISNADAGKVYNTRTARADDYCGYCLEKEDIAETVLERGGE